MTDHPLYSAFGRAVDEAMSRDESIVLVTMDTGRDLFCDGLRSKYPGRALDAGICEQHAVSLASALALSGYRVIVATYAAFLLRGLEQIINQTTEGTSVCYVGSLAGPLPASGPGVSHESLHDAEIMIELGLGFAEPRTPAEVEKALIEALEAEESTYVRLCHCRDCDTTHSYGLERRA